MSADMDTPAGIPAGIPAGTDAGTMPAPHAGTPTGTDADVDTDSDTDTDTDVTFVTKYKAGEPVIVETDGVDLQGATMQARPVEEWRQRDGRTMTLSEINYGRGELLRIVDKVCKSRDNFLGPDMFHLTDSDGVLRMRVWQWIAHRCIGIFIYDRGAVRSYYLKPSRTIKNTVIRGEIREIWKEDTGTRAEWTYHNVDPDGAIFIVEHDTASSAIW